MNDHFCRRLVLASFLAAIFLAVCPAAFSETSTPGCETEFEPAPVGYDFIQETVNQKSIPPGSKIGKVYYTSLEVFDEDDPRENYWIYRWANRFHIETKDEVLQNQILFNPGEMYNPRLIEESGRLLRSQKYLYDATVRPVSLCDGNVDVEVISRDVWSLSPEVSFKRSGGENTYRFSIRETNAFGSGQEVAIRTKKDLDRKSNEFVYKNTNIRGSRIEGRAIFSNNDDGSEQFLSAQLPFYALDSRRAWGVRLNKFERIDSQFFRGDDVTEVQHERSDFLASHGFSNGLQNGIARRWLYGYRYIDETFSPGDELPPPEEFPIDRRLSYPFIQYESVVDDYVKVSNFNQIHRTEDLHLGHSFFTRLGYASSAFGSDEDRLVLEGAFNDTILYNNKILWRHNISLRGLWNFETKEPEEVLVDYTMRYFRTQTEHRSFFASFNAVYSKNLNTNQQVVLGGETGARAFTNRLQVGDRRVVLSLEERFYSDIHILNLLRFGWAMFIDVGRAWEPGVDSTFEDDYLVDIGFGLRLASTKGDSGRVIHIDLAFPLTNKDDPDVNSSELSVTLKNTF